MRLLRLASFSGAYFTAVNFGRVVGTPAQRDIANVAEGHVKKHCISGAVPWAQCGGIGYTGPTVCAFNITCTYSNPYQSQCLPPDPTVTYPIVGLYQQCGGPNYTGPTACTCGNSCIVVNASHVFSTCQPVQA